MTDRKELRRRYIDDALGRAGVYAIRHAASGRLLVGASPDAQAALNRHLFELRLKMHRNRALQADWNLDGEAGFAHEILDLVTPPDDPAFDPKAELGALLVLWREELGLAGAADYALPAAKGCP